jgi:hypothetical protein
MQSAKKVAQELPSTPVLPVDGSAIGHAAELDIERFRISQDFAAHLGAKKVAVTVSVRRPDRQHWVFIHPDRAWRIAVSVLEDKVNQRTYLVEPSLVPEVIGDLVPKLLVTYASRQGNVSLWPIRLPDEAGRLDGYNESALKIIERYPGPWIRVLSNRTDACYDVLEMASVESPSPKWPEGGFQYLSQLAFQNRVISSLNHPFLKALRGESL